MLGALYLRLVGTSIEVYNYLEPLYNDYRKLKIMDRSGQLKLSHVDEFVDDLLHRDRSCDIILPRIQVYSTAILLTYRGLLTGYAQQFHCRMFLPVKFHTVRKCCGCGLETPCTGADRAVGAKSECSGRGS